MLPVKADRIYRGNAIDTNHALDQSCYKIVDFFRMAPGDLWMLLQISKQGCGSCFLCTDDNNIWQAAKNGCRILVNSLFSAGTSIVDDFGGDFFVSWNIQSTRAEKFFDCIAWKLKSAIVRGIGKIDIQVIIPP